MKKLLTILLLIMLIISLLQIANMYALYKQENQGDYSNLLGVWSIKVNGADISSGDQNLTFNMTEDNLIYLDSARVKSQKMAPGTQACFEIIIDPTNTDVSVIYQLDMQFEQLTTKMKLVKVENWFQKSGNEEKIENIDISTNLVSNTHKAVIPISKINDKYLNHVKLYFEWINDENNNAVDSEIGQTENAKISVPLKINLKQYTGEVIGNEQGN